MHELLQKYFLNKEKEQKQNEEKEKRALLLSQGLFEKVYSEGSVPTTEYPHLDYKNNKYYKKVPIEISDDEYEYLKKINKQEDKKIIVKPENKIATALTIIAAIVFIGGFIMGIVFGNVEVTKGTYYQYTETEFSFGIALSYWAISLVSGIFILGFAEIIKLLEYIKLNK